MDYYSTLGLKRGATEAEIKKAYRSMAMKHHPDRGGNEADFKRISEAYDVLSDPNKKQMFDAGVDPNNQQRGGFGGGNPFEFHFNSGNMDDMFGQFGFGGFGRQPQRKNRSLSITVELTLEDVLNGKDVSAEITIPGSKNKIINIQIPPGIESGQQIRYEGMGDQSIPNLRPGDLIVNVAVRQHQFFKREGALLILEKEISVWDALLGTSLEIKTLDNKTLSITVPQGTQPETVLRITGEGLPDMRTKQRGHLLLKIKVTIPKKLSPEQIEHINQAKYGI